MKTCSIVILIVLQVSYALGTPPFFNFSEKSMIEVKRDKLKKITTLYLVTGFNTDDSLQIEDTDFIIDSLYQINDTLWKYMYSYGCEESDCNIWSRQILLQNIDSKIHISFIGRYHLYTKDVNSVVTGYSYNDKYNISISDSASFIFKLDAVSQKNIHNGIRRDTLKYTSNLFYSREHRVFYNSEVVFDGEYEFVLKEKAGRLSSYGKDVISINLKKESVLMLELEDSKFIYFRKKWFSMHKYTSNGATRLTAFTPITPENW